MRIVVSFLLGVFMLSTSKIVAQSCGYSFQKIITIDKSKISGTAALNNFTVLINLTDNDLRTTANGGDVQNANGFDIAFFDGNDQLLAHELMSYTATTGAILAWVKVPTLYTAFDTDIKMVYGNSNVTTDPSTTATWDTDYEAVLHLQENGNGSSDEYADATINDHDGTGGGLAGAGVNSRTPARTTGKFGFAQDFNDAGNQDLIRLDVVNDAAWTGVTVEAWVNPDDNGDDRIFGKSWGTSTNDQTWLLRKTGGTGGTRMRTNTNNNGGFDPATLANGSWQHLAVTWDGASDELIVYLDGVQQGSTTLNGATMYGFPTADEPTIGNTTTLNRGYDGQLQETRVSKVARSADWLLTQFNNQDDPGSFYSVGPETAGTFTPTVPTCGYSFRKEITIDNTRVSGSGSHTNFPVLISLVDNDLRTVANGGGVQNDNGYDIVFTDDNLTPLDFQFEEYLGSTGTINAWVKIPSLPTGSDYILNMFYGNSGVFADPSTSCTWTSDYKAVYHLHDDFLDGTVTGNDGTNNGTTDNTGGVSGDCQSFDGTNDFIQMGVTDFVANNASHTVSVWANFSVLPGGSENFLSITNNGSSSAVQLGYTSNISRSWKFGGTTLVSSGGSESTNNWHQYAYTFDGTTHSFYVDGTAFTSTVAAQTAVPNDFELGRWTGGSEYYGGLMDEARYSTVVKSAGWITTEYNNMSSPGTFYSVGTEVTLAASSTGDGDWDQTGIWNTGAVPGLGANVTITDLVDLDDRDVTICNLTLSDNAGGTDAIMEVENGRTMTVTENVFMNLQNTGNDLELRVKDGNSKLIIEGDLLADHDGGDDIITDVEDGGDSLIIRGNMILEHDGGDNLDIQVDNATAVMLVEGNVVANMNAGTDDLIEFDLNAGQMIVNGNLFGTRSGTFGDFEIDMDGGNLTVDTLSIISSGGTGNDIVTMMVDQTSTLTAGYVYLEMGGGDDHFVDINVNGGTAGTFRVTGNMDIVKTGGDDLFIRPQQTSSLFHVMGDMTLTSSGGEETQIQVTSDGTFDVDGNFTITHTDGQICHIFTQGLGANPTFNVDGDMIVNWNGGGDLFNPDLEGGNFNVGNDFIVTQNPGTANIAFNCDGGDITVTDTFLLTNAGDNNIFIDLNSTSNLTAGTLVGILNGDNSASTEELLIDVDDQAQINVTANMELEANTGNDVELHLGENSTGSTAQLNIGGNLVLDHNGAVGVDDIQFYIKDNSVVDITGSFTMETDGSAGGTGNFITRLENNGILRVGGNVVMDNNTGAGYLEIELNDATKLEVGGNIVRNASPNDFGLIQSNDATTTIEYNGSTNTQIFADEDGAGSDGIEYELVVINNSFGTEPQLTMAAPVTLTNSITFTDGVLQTTSANLLTIADGAVTNGGSAGSYVSGPVRKRGDDAFIFPLGDGGVWARLEITDLQNTPLATDEFTAEYTFGLHPQSFIDSSGYAGDNDDLYNVSINEYWEVTRDNGNTTPKIRLYWEDGSRSAIDNLADLRVAHLTGATSWTNEGGTTTGTVVSGTVTSTTNINSFSPFTFGSLSSASNPLPVELLFFDAIPEGQVVKLLWATLSQINNDYFVVERSKDAIHFEEVVRERGAGNDNTRIDYESADDQPYRGVSYYRLKQVDFNGSYSYSDIVAVSFNKNFTPLIAYPNPLRNTEQLKFNKVVSGSVFSAVGELIQSFYETSKVELLDVKKGLYFVKTTDGETVKVIVE